MLVCLLAMAAGPADAQRVANPSDSTIAKPVVGDDEWVRCLRDDDDKPIALQTAVARYVGTAPGSRGPVFVDLVGAIHVGDLAYYQGLDQRFRQYDALLYELVAPEGTVVPRGGKVDNTNALGALQTGMQGMLALEHQLEQVDYTRPNFVHADMSPETLFATMEKRDEGFLQMYFRMVGQSIAEQTKASRRGESAEFDMMKALFAKDRPRQLKIAMASQLTQLEGLLTSFGGEKGSTLIHERNRTAMDVLAREITAGKQTLGVFYGAGHLADMDKRLRERFGLRQTEKEWVTAWDLSE